MESPPEGITIELADESNLYEWKVYMEGPEGSPYQVCQPSFMNHCSSILGCFVPSASPEEGNGPARLACTRF